MTTNESLAAYLPLLSAPELVRLAELCGNAVPTWLERRVERARKECQMNDEQRKKRRDEIRERQRAEFFAPVKPKQQPRNCRDKKLLERRIRKLQSIHAPAANLGKQDGACKAVVDGSGNRFASLSKAALSVEYGNPTGLRKAIRDGSVYQGRRWYWAASAPAEVLRMGKRSEAA